MGHDRATNSVRRYDPPNIGSTRATPELRGELLPVVHREWADAARTLFGRRHYVELPARPLAASLARGHVGTALTGWQEDLTERAQLIVSELVANAIKATADALAEPADRGEPICGAGHLWIGVLQVRDYVVVEVWDCSPLPPQLVNPSADEVGGRGLLLVSEMATQWSYRWHRSGGKVVWAMLGTA